MQQLIEKMVTDFERGKLSRRQLAAALAGLVADAAPGASDFKAVGVNHVTLRVPDVERSTKFYQEVFGMPMRKAYHTVKILSLNANCFFGIEAANGKGPAVAEVGPEVPPPSVHGWVFVWIMTSVEARSCGQVRVRSRTV